jgi:hypothetical protein
MPSGEVERAGLVAGKAGLATRSYRADLEASTGLGRVHALAEREQEVARRIEFLDPMAVGVGHVDVAVFVSRHGVRLGELTS